MDIKEKLLIMFEDKKYQPMTIDELYKTLELSSSQEFTDLAKILNYLEDEYIITHNKKGCFALLSTFSLIKGVIDIKDAGYGFIDTEEQSVFVKRDNLRGAITGDIVLASYTNDKIGRLEGKVERIIKRSTTFIVGKLQIYKNKYIVKSVNFRIDLWVYIKPENLNKAVKGDMVQVDIIRFYSNNTADGIVKCIIGKATTKNIDITSLIVTSGVNTEFSNEVMQIAKSIPQTIDVNKYQNRRDLRDKIIITIDGDDAKDLDDAVRCEKLPNGNYLLGVYIADVSEYVKENSLLDQSAFERGTSIYLVNQVIPMLPKQLSNGICSLNPSVDRLVMACEMEIDQEGHVINHDIFEGIIKTTYRMTYNNVNLIIEKNDSNKIDEYKLIVPMLMEMKNLASILNKMRVNRGSFNFETTEAKVLLDDNGKAIDIEIQNRGLGEKLIEEFMLVANETVATAMTWLDVPFIYRVHEEPSEEKIGKFIQVLNNFHYTFKVKNKKNMSKALQQVLIDLEQQEDSISKTIINNTLLRSMMKAKYLETNLGHYGLASDCYTHFTSPIRRYPDLLVHRLIKQFMLNDTQISDKDNAIDFFRYKVHISSDQASKCERKAESLERDVLDMKKCEYMISFTNEKFYGIISSITNWGIYITLDNTIEGLVRFDDMNDDYYDIDELNAKIIGRKKGNIYQMGDSVLVKLVDVNLEKRQISFKLLGRKK